VSSHRPTGPRRAPSFDNRSCRDRYVFWRTGENLLRGYALPEAIGSQLLVQLHRCASAPAGSSGVANGESGDGRGDAMRRAATDVVVADVRRLPDELSAGDLARGNFGGEQTAAEAGELAVGSTIRVMSDPTEMARAFKRDWSPGWTDKIAEAACGITLDIHEEGGDQGVNGGTWKLLKNGGEPFPYRCVSAPLAYGVPLTLFAPSPLVHASSTEW